MAVVSVFYVKRAPVNNGSGFTVRKYRTAGQAESAVLRDERAYAVVVDGKQMSRTRFLHWLRDDVPDLTPETPWEDCFDNGVTAREKEEG